MTQDVKLPGPILQSLLRIHASQLLAIAEQVSERDFQGESFAACRISGQLRQIGQDLQAMIADVEALEKSAP